MSNQSIMLPEWSPVSTVLLAWPHPRGDWQSVLEEANRCYWGLIEALSARVHVTVLLHPSICLQTWRSQAEQRLVGSKGLSVCVIDYDDTWIRDYGPISTREGYLNFTFNGWGGKYQADADNGVNERLFDRPEFVEGAESLSTLALVIEGGALETNGRILLLNKDCVVTESRNPGMAFEALEQHLKQHLAGEHIAWLEGVQLTGDDTDGHIDTIARFANPNTLVISGRNPDHPDALALSALYRQCCVLAQQHQWMIYELPTPIVRSRKDDRLLPATYANFLIVNDCVFVPVYGVEEDTYALRVLALAFRGFKLVPVQCETLLEQNGSLHCATMQLARSISFRM